MRKLLSILCLFSCTMVHAQLEKGSKLVGFGVNIISNDGLYNTTLVFETSSSERHYGMNILPCFGYALKRNWLVGGQAIFGAERHRYLIGTLFEETDIYTDLGIAAFTRLYLDLSKNGKWKVYGAAGIESVAISTKRSYEKGGIPNSTRYNDFNALPALGAGFAYFGKRLAVDLSMSTTALRVGFYKVLSSRKK